MGISNVVYNRGRITFQSVNFISPNSRVEIYKIWTIGEGFLFLAGSYNWIPPEAAIAEFVKCDFAIRIIETRTQPPSHYGNGTVGIRFQIIHTTNDASIMYRKSKTKLN